MTTGVNFRTPPNISLTNAGLTNRRLSNEGSRTSAARSNSAFGVAGSDVSAEMLRRRQGDVTLNEGILQLSFQGSFASFIETGKLADSDAMEDYSRFDSRMSRINLADIAKNAFFFDSNQGVRSMEEMARLFDERLDVLRNATNISEERRGLEIEALKRGFVLAVEARFHGVNGGPNLELTESGLARFADSRFASQQSIGQFAVNESVRILKTGASEETQNLLFQALEEVVLRTSRSLNGFAAFKASLVARGEELDAVDEKQDSQNARSEEFIAALREDMHNIRSNLHREISAELFTQAQNLFRQWGWTIGSSGM